jgi:hypothetical protein
MFVQEMCKSIIEFMVLYVGFVNTILNFPNKKGNKNDIYIYIYIYIYIHTHTHTHLGLGFMAI